MFKIIKFIKSLNIYTYVVIAFSCLLFIIGFKNKKIDKLKEKNAKHEKLEEMTEEMEVEEVKQEKIEQEAKKKINDSDWRNKI